MATGQPSAFAAENTDKSSDVGPNAAAQSIKRIWVGSEPRTPATGRQALYAGAPEKLSGQGTPIAQGQNIGRGASSGISASAGLGDGTILATPIKLLCGKCIADASESQTCKHRHLPNKRRSGWTTERKQCSPRGTAGFTSRSSQRRLTHWRCHNPCSRKCCACWTIQNRTETVHLSASTERPSYDYCRGVTNCYAKQVFGLERCKTVYRWLHSGYMATFSILPCYTINSKLLRICARDRNRTGTPVIHEAADFKSDVSTYFTTRAVLAQ